MTDDFYFRFSGTFSTRIVTKDRLMDKRMQIVTDRPKQDFSTALPFGRPRCDIKIGFAPGCADN